MDNNIKNNNLEEENNEAKSILEEDIDIIFKDVVSLPFERLEKLIEAEATLKILCRFIASDKPYHYDYYRAVTGDLLPPVKKEGAE